MTAASCGESLTQCAPGLSFGDEIKIREKPSNRVRLLYPLRPSLTLAYMIYIYSAIIERNFGIVMYRRNDGIVSARLLALCPCLSVCLCSCDNDTTTFKC